MKTLLQIYNEHKRGDWPDKNSTHSYLTVYEELLEPYRNTAKNVLEIGLMSGESLCMWAEYFSGTVYGMDCDVKPINGLADLTKAIEDGYNIVIGDAASPFDIAKNFVGMKFDVVIEDANHDIQQQLDIYQNLKPYLNKGAIYIIEDVQDIDATKELFEKIDPEKSVEILDRRHIKQRYDDVLIIIK